MPKYEENKMTVEIVKIFATGCYKRYMTIKLYEGKYRSIRIPEDLYEILKKNGVITAQKLRGQKDKENKKKGE